MLMINELQARPHDAEAGGSIPLITTTFCRAPYPAARNLNSASTASPAVGADAATAAGQP
jgi:hypothetical protein